MIGLPILSEVISEMEEKNFFLKIYKIVENRGLINQDKAQEIKREFYECLYELLPKNTFAPQKSELREAANCLLVMLDFALNFFSEGEIDRAVIAFLGMQIKTLYEKGNGIIEKIINDSLALSSQNNSVFIDGDIDKMVLHFSLLGKKDFCLEQYYEKNSYFKTKRILARARAEVIFGKFLEHSHPELEEVLDDHRWDILSVLGAIMINLGLYRKFSIEIEFQDIQVFQKLFYQNQVINSATKTFIIKSFELAIKTLPKVAHDQMIEIFREHLEYLEEDFLSIKKLELIHFYSQVYLYKAKVKRRKVSAKAPQRDQLEKIIHDFKKLKKTSTRIKFLLTQKPTIIAILTSEYGLTNAEYLQLLLELPERLLADYLTLLGVIYDEHTEQIIAYHSDKKIDKKELERVFSQFEKKDQIKYQKIGKKLSRELEETI